jgi:outer membrane biosynthesis protein TonB
VSHRYFDAAGVVETSTKSANPVYRDHYVQGNSIPRVTISIDGSIGEIKVKQGLGYGLIEQVIAAAKQIVFQPKQINGMPVNVTKTVEFKFNIY